MRLTRRDRQQAVEALTSLLAVVEQGEISADTPQERRMLRRIEGAVAALDAETVSRVEVGRPDGSDGT